MSLLEGVAGYLKIYYKGRTELPNDESNGNTPLVSAYEVAWYSWKVFDEMFRLTDDNEHREYRDLIRRLIEQEKIKNNVDLCYQTIAFAEIDRAAYAERIKRNAERILSLQRAMTANGRCCLKRTARRSSFRPIIASTRSRAPVTRLNIRRSRSRSKFLFERQQEWGGWFDPKQSYENFRTPFRETQFAVMALSEFYKGTDGKGGSREGAAIVVDEATPLLRLQQMDGSGSDRRPQSDAQPDRRVSTARSR